MSDRIIHALSWTPPYFLISPSTFSFPLLSCSLPLLPHTLMGIYRLSSNKVLYFDYFCIFLSFVVWITNLFIFITPTSTATTLSLCLSSSSTFSLHRSCSNRAECHLRSKNAKKAIHDCNRSLCLDTVTRVKVQWRRSKAYQSLDLDYPAWLDMQ